VNLENEARRLAFHPIILSETMAANKRCNWLKLELIDLLKRVEAQAIERAAKVAERVHTTNEYGQNKGEGSMKIEIAQAIRNLNKEGECQV